MTLGERLARHIRDGDQLRRIIADMGEAARLANEAVSLLLGDGGARQGEALKRQGEALIRQREALKRLDEVVRRVASARDRGIDTSAWTDEVMQVARQTRLAVAMDEPKITDEPELSAAALDEAIRLIDRATAIQAAVQASVASLEERLA